MYLGLGSNLGNRHNNIQRAVDHLESSKHIEVMCTSEMLEAEPVGCMDQNDYLNTVVEAAVDISPKELLAFLKEIEGRIGRQKKHDWDSRTIDIDILFYGDQLIVTDELVIPHPLVCERIFVLKPMAKLNPGLVHPVFERPMKQIFQEREQELALYYCAEM